MKIRHSLVVICLLIPLIAQAGNTRPGNYSTIEYWVLGSFQSESRALIEARRIQSVTGFEVSLIPSTVQSNDFVRIVVPISASEAERQLQKTAFVDAGIPDAWAVHPHILDEQLVSLSGDTRKKTVTPVVAPAPVTPVASDQEDMLAMQMKKSYVKFCVTKATASERARYCTNQDFFMTTRKVLSGNTEESKEYRDFIEHCVSDATPGQREIKCNNQGFEDKARTARS